MAQILDGRAPHAFHPGGGLHHAMRRRAAGFCIYNDVALAIALARDAGHRVLYVDVDVHHGDGVQELFWDDPEVLTVSFHETGETLFPGTGFADEGGGPGAPGRSVNVPLEPGTRDGSWLAALRAVVPALADAFRPGVLVTQNGCDTHAWDPLAHLAPHDRRACRGGSIAGRNAQRARGGRWLATGGGGYDAPGGSPDVGHRLARPGPPNVPVETPEAWRARWAEEAARHGRAPLPGDDAGPRRPGSARAGRRPRAQQGHRLTGARAFARGARGST